MTEVVTNFEDDPGPTGVIEGGILREAMPPFELVVNKRLSQIWSALQLAAGQLIQNAMMPVDRSRVTWAVLAAERDRTMQAKRLLRGKI